MREINGAGLLLIYELFTKLHHRLNPLELTDQTLQDCCFKARGLIMSAFNDDGFQNEWYLQLKRYMENYEKIRDTLKEKKIPTY